MVFCQPHENQHVDLLLRIILCTLLTTLALKYAHTAILQHGGRVSVFVFTFLSPTRIRRDDRQRERLCWIMEGAKPASQPLGVSL